MGSQQVCRCVKTDTPGETSTVVTHIRKGRAALGLASILIYHFRKNEALHFCVRGVNQMEDQPNQACSGLLMRSWCDGSCFPASLRHHKHCSQNRVGSYWYCCKNVALLLRLLYLGSDAREVINRVRMQRVKIVKVCTEEAGMRNLTSLPNSLACSEYPSSSGIQCIVFVGSGHRFPEAT